MFAADAGALRYTSRLLMMLLMLLPMPDFLRFSLATPPPLYALILLLRDSVSLSLDAATCLILPCCYI